MLSLSPLTVLPCSPVEQIDAAHAAGLDAVGLRLLPVVETDMHVMSDVSLRRAIGRRLQATGIAVLDVEVARIGPASNIEALRPVLQYAQDLGAKSIAVTSVLRDEYLLRSEPEVVQRLGDLCEIATRYNMTVMIEFMVFRGIATLDDALRVVRKVGHPAMGICVDALHLARSGGLPSHVAAIDPAFLRCVQLCDAPAASPPTAEIPGEARGRRLFPGQGGLPLRELLQSVPEGVPLSIEAPTASRGNFSIKEIAVQAAQSSRDLLESLRGTSS